MGFHQDAPSRKEPSWPSALGCRVYICSNVCALREHRCSQLQRVEKSSVYPLSFAAWAVSDTSLSSLGVILR